jgi:MFS family permease
MTNSSAGNSKLAPSALYRWLILIFVSIAMFGNYYIFDSIATVFDLLSTQLEFTDQELGLFYTAYSIAAVIVLLVGGFIIDKFGTKKSILLFAVICLIAAIVVASTPEFGVMLVGRFILGIGSEPLIVAITTALAKWFKGKELSFAFGVNLLIARLGSVSADWSPSFARPLYSNWQDPLWLASFVAGLSVAAAILYWILENRSEKIHSLGSVGETEKLELKNLYKFSRSYWYIVALCVVFYSTVFPFRAFAIKYFIEAHGLSRDAGGALNSVLPLAAGIATPLFGLLVDKIGKRSLFMAFGSIILLPLFLVVTYAPAGPDISLTVPFLGSYTWPLTLIIVMLLLGVAFSMIPAIMWPSVAYIVEEKRLGSGYSLMTLCQQVGMAAIPWLIGFLNDSFSAGPENPDGYTPGMWVFTALSSLGLLFSFLLYKTEKSPGGHGLETITTKTGASH